MSNLLRQSGWHPYMRQYARANPESFPHAKQVSPLIQDQFRLALCLSPRSDCCRSRAFESNKDKASRQNRKTSAAKKSGLGARSLPEQTRNNARREHRHAGRKIEQAKG